MAFLPFSTTAIMSSFNLQTTGLVSHDLPQHRFYNFKKNQDFILQQSCGVSRMKNVNMVQGEGCRADGANYCVDNSIPTCQAFDFLRIDDGLRK